MNASKRTWTLAWWLGSALLVGCATPPDPNALPACDAPEVQEVARQAAAESVKIPFALSSFSEVQAESSEAKRACRVRAKHAASGAAIWMRFTLARRPIKKKSAPAKEASASAKAPEQELAVVFAPIE